MYLKCIESVHMNVEKIYQAFTEGEKYRARWGVVKGSNDDPYAFERVLKAINDKGESHIIKNRENDELDAFFYKHFEEDN
ncbi:hypothetical protein MUO14_24010 [Halobacillus shinanisalinarum]|uniref:Uncharacterized protein n=1 Tax=Halobacillus shinanisalinarum TaxID=2932258 RepID=A0ABY4H348_9BACI|nr:hypothetical protein [Halobacillus shinanisalinarum]UOQ93397.1 hypothetical protein MUO14_24010 [Halobacillus shinanisalinarum]